MVVLQSLQALPSCILTYIYFFSFFLYLAGFTNDPKATFFMQKSKHIFFLILFSCITLNIFGQYESLLHKSYAEKMPVLDTMHARLMLLPTTKRIPMRQGRSDFTSGTGRTAASFPTLQELQDSPKG